MPKPNLYYINTKLPDTATVAYYDVETDQNLTAKEWNQLHPEVSPSEIKVINKSGSNYVSEKKEGYGPCGWSNKNCVCYVGSGYTPLYMSCPSCSNKELSVWVHSSSGCGGPMYISEYLNLECKRCYTNDHWRKWRFLCSRHEGYQYATSFASFQDALRLGLALQAGDIRMQDLVKRIGIRLLQES